MDIGITQRKNGILLTVAERVDAFSFENAKSCITSAAHSGCENLAIDLSKATFLSLPSIKFIHSLALQLRKNGGSLSLIAPTEKMKRQFDIYSSLEPLHIFKHTDDWERFTAAGEA